MILWSLNTSNAQGDLPYRCYWEDATYVSGGTSVSKLTKSSVEGSTPKGIVLITNVFSGPKCGWLFDGWSIVAKDVASGRTILNETTNENPHRIMLQTQTIDDDSSVSIEAYASYSFHGSGNVMRVGNKIVRSSLDGRKIMMDV